MNGLIPNKLAVFGAVGLSAIAFVGIPESAKAAKLCGPGEHWVDTCSAGVDQFKLSKAVLDLLLMPPGQPMQQIILKLTGPVTITRDNPVDALVGDPDLGNVGIVNQHLGVIKTSLEEKFTGGGITLTGRGVGAIVEATELGINRPDLADSFFKVFAEVEGSFGRARNMNPITVSANKWLQGVPPNNPTVPPVSPPNPSLTYPNLPTPPLPNVSTGRCDALDPLGVIIYCGFENVDFFAVDEQGEFILDGQGNKIKVATLLGEKHGVVPEPFTIIGSATALGFGALFKRKSSKKRQ